MGCIAADAAAAFAGMMIVIYDLSTTIAFNSIYFISNECGHRFSCELAVNPPHARR